MPTRADQSIRSDGRFRSTFETEALPAIRGGGSPPVSMRSRGPCGCCRPLTVMNTNDSGAGSLRADIAAAHPGDTIAFSARAWLGRPSH